LVLVLESCPETTEDEDEDEDEHDWVPLKSPLPSSIISYEQSTRELTARRGEAASEGANGVGVGRRAGGGRGAAGARGRAGAGGERSGAGGRGAPRGSRGEQRPGTDRLLAAGRGALGALPGGA